MLATSLVVLASSPACSRYRDDVDQQRIYDDHAQQIVDSGAESGARAEADASDDAPLCASDGADASEDCAEKEERAVSCDVDASPCGGDVTGIWDVVDCPLELNGEVNLIGFGLGCTGAKITSGYLKVSGSWSADDEGNVSDKTLTRGEQVFEVPSSCFDVGIVVTCDRFTVPVVNALGYDTADCIDNPETNGCTCVGTFEQQGGVAAISAYPLDTGNYSTSGTTLTTVYRGIDTAYEYCVRDDIMTLTFAAPSPVGSVQGSVVLAKR